jgi:hypothetical protein
VNVTKSWLAIIVLGSMLIPPSWADEAAEVPTLRGALAPPAASESAPPEQASRKSASGNVAATTDDKSKSDSEASQPHPYKALKGGVSQTDINEPEDSLSGRADREIAAIGISWNLFNHVITYVDPGSDLYGKVEPGKDRFLGLGKLDAGEVVRTGYNIGDVDSWVDAIIRGRDHIIRDIPVRRRPVSSFAPKFARSFARQYRLRH